MAYKGPVALGADEVLELFTGHGETSAAWVPAGVTGDLDIREADAFSLRTVHDEGPLAAHL